MNNFQSEWASGSSAQFAPMSLLNLLAEVATEKLYSDPSVQMISTPKVIEEVPSIEVFTSVELAVPDLKPNSSEKSVVNEGKPLTLLQVSKMSDSNLLKYFSMNQANEIKRKFYFTCRLLPSSCEQMTQSFGNEDKARNLMKKHLRSHLRALLQVNNTCTSQENYILRSVVKQKLPLSSSEISSRKKASKVELKARTTLNEKENSVHNSITPFDFKSNKSYGSVKEKDSKHALKIIRPNSSSDLRQLSVNQNKQPMEQMCEGDLGPLVKKGVSVFVSGSECINHFTDVTSPTTTFPLSAETSSETQVIFNCKQESVQENVIDNISGNGNKYMKSPQHTYMCHDLPDNTMPASNNSSGLGLYTFVGNLINNSLEEVPSQCQYLEDVDAKLTNECISLTIHESSSLRQKKKFKRSHFECDDHGRKQNDYVTVSHDHGYVGGIKGTKNKVMNSDQDVKVHNIPTDMGKDVDSKQYQNGDFTLNSIKKEDTLLSQHMSIELQGGIMAQDLTNSKTIIEDNAVLGSVKQENQITPLPVVGSEIEFNHEKIKYENDYEPMESLENDGSYIKVEDEKDSIIRKQRKGKGKFIGQSKIEKEMALELINQIKSQSLMDFEALECNICDPPRIFTAPSTLISHYKSHAGICPYICSLCQAVFTRQHSLNYHMLIHSNQTRFTCDDCGRKFRHPSHFKEHRRRHTGESPFSCMDCPMRFKTRNTYKRHLRTRHGKVLTTQGQVQYICEMDGNNSETSSAPEGTIEIKTEDEAIISMVNDELNLNVVKNENEDSSEQIKNIYYKTDQHGQSNLSDICESTSNLDYDNLLHNITPDISIIAVDKSLLIADTKAVPSYAMPVAGNINSEVVVDNGKGQNLHNFSETLSSISNQDPEIHYDISISPAEPLKPISANQLERRQSQILNEINTFHNNNACCDVSGKDSCQIYQSISSDNLSYWKSSAMSKVSICKDDDKFQSHSVIDINSSIHKEACKNIELNNMNSATLVNTIESVVNMELNGLALPSQPQYPTQLGEIRESKYFVEGSAKNNSVRPNTYSNEASHDNITPISNSSSHISLNETAKNSSDKWTNLMKEVLCLSSAVSKGKQKSQSESMSVSKAMPPTYLSKKQVKHPLSNGPTSLKQQLDVATSTEKDKLITNIPRSQHKIKNPSNVLSTLNKDVRNINSLYTDKECLSKDCYYSNNVTAFNRNISILPTLGQEIDASQLELDKKKTSFQSIEKVKNLCHSSYEENSLSKNIKAQFPSITQTEVKKTQLLTEDLRVNPQSVLSNQVKEMYVIKYVKKSASHFTNVFKTDMHDYINETDDNMTNFKSSFLGKTTDTQYVGSVSETSTKSKSIVVTTSKPTKFFSEINLTQLPGTKETKSVLPVSKDLCLSDKVTSQVHSKSDVKSDNLGTGASQSGSESINGANNLTIHKSSSANVGSYIKVPVLSTTGVNNSVVHNLLIPAATSRTTIFPSNCSIISSNIVPLSVTSSSSPVILQPNVTHTVSNRSAPPWSDGASTIRANTSISGPSSANSNTITLYPSNAVFLNSNETNIDSEALTLNFSNAESQQSNIFILNSGNGVPLSLNSNSKSVIFGIGKSVFPNENVTFSIPSSSHGMVDSLPRNESVNHRTNEHVNYSKSNIVTSTSSLIIPTRTNTITSSTPLSSLKSRENIPVIRSTELKNNTNSKFNYVSTPLREPRTTGILSHLLSSGKSISSGSFYYSNYDGLLKNDKNSVQ